MPYRLIEKAGRYAVQTKATGATHGFTSKSKAQAQLRILESLMKQERRR